MKLTGIILGLTLMFGGLHAAAFEKEASSKVAVIKLSSEKPLVVGNNTIVFEVFKNGKATTGDEITVKSFMPAMPGMPYMEDKTPAKELGNGKYESVVNFSMGGTWQIQIFVTPKEGKKYRLKTSVNL
ncbi:FixH family protein [bacterium]|nr:FixH family protein [bacterium]MBU1991263.1 FixH family protein [bacterium]